MDLENKIKELYNKEHKYVKEQRIIDILKVVLVDKITNIDKIVFLTSTNEETIKKYLEDETLFADFLTHKEFLVFKNKLKNILLQKQRSEEDKDIYVLGKVFDEILCTRHKLEDVCKNNGYSLSRFKTVIDLTDYIDRNFGPNMRKRVKNKITQNGIIRDSIPRKMYLIEDRNDVLITIPEIYYLNEIDFKKLSFVSAYLSSEANIEFVSKKFEVNTMTVLNVLDDSKLQNILKPVYYEMLVRYINIEKLLLSSSITEKKNLLSNVIKKLYENNFDMNIVMEEFKITSNLLEKILKEITKNPLFDQNIRQEINELLNTEKDEKVK